MMEDTEWNDILRAKGILPPKPEPETEGPDVEDITKDPREDMTVDEIDRLLEDDMDDDRVLASYRAKRMQELKEYYKSAEQQQLQLQGGGIIEEINAQEFVVKVTDASRSCPVIVFLYKDGLEACQILHQHLLKLAHKYATLPTSTKIKNASNTTGAVKWAKIVGDKCIPGYPDRNLPTLLIYVGGDLRRQVVGLNMFGGAKAMRTENLERFLVGLDVLPRSNDEESDDDGSED